MALSLVPCACGNIEGDSGGKEEDVIILSNLEVLVLDYEGSLGLSSNNNSSSSYLLITTA